MRSPCSAAVAASSLCPFICVSVPHSCAAVSRHLSKNVRVSASVDVVGGVAAPGMYVCVFLCAISLASPSPYQPTAIILRCRGFFLGGYRRTPLVPAFRRVPSLPPPPVLWLQPSHEDSRPLSSSPPPQSCAFRVTLPATFTRRRLSMSSPPFSVFANPPPRRYASPLRFHSFSRSSSFLSASFSFAISFFFCAPFSRFLCPSVSASFSFSFFFFFFTFSSPPTSAQCWRDSPFGGHARFWPVSV